MNNNEFCSKCGTEVTRHQAGPNAKKPGEWYDKCQTKDCYFKFLGKDPNRPVARGRGGNDFSRSGPTNSYQQSPTTTTQRQTFNNTANRTSSEFVTGGEDPKFLTGFSNQIQQPTPLMPKNPPSFNTNTESNSVQGRRFNFPPFDQDNVSTQDILNEMKGLRADIQELTKYFNINTKEMVTTVAKALSMVDKLTEAGKDYRDNPQKYIKAAMEEGEIMDEEDNQ